MASPKTAIPASRSPVTQTIFETGTLLPNAAMVTDQHLIQMTNMAQMTHFAQREERNSQYLMMQQALANEELARRHSELDSSQVSPQQQHDNLMANFGQSDQQA